MELPLSGPRLEGTLVPCQAAADVLWSHLLVGKSKTDEHTDKSEGVSGVENEQETKRRHTKESRANRHYQDFQVMSTTNALTSMFWEPSFTLGDCRTDMTDCQD